MILTRIPRNQPAPYAKRFGMFEDEPDMPINGVGRLNPYLTINGVTKAPEFRYKGGDADATELGPWEYGETLDRVSVETQPEYNQGSPGLGPDDDSVGFTESDYYEAPNTTAGQMGTDDVVIEVVFRYDGAHQKTLAGTRQSGGIGWMLYQTSTGIILYLDDDVVTKSIDSASGLTIGGWYYGFVTVDRSGSAQWYLNHSPSGSPLDITGLGSLDSGLEFRFGARQGGSAWQYTSNIAYLAMWKGAGWLDSHDQAAIAAKRAAQFWGYYPSFHRADYVIQDGDMEAGDTSAWTAGNSADLSKSTVERSGIYSLSIRENGTANPYAYQSALTVGQWYRARGWARVQNEDEMQPRLYCGTTLLWAGVTSPDDTWEPFDVTFKADSTELRFYAWGGWLASRVYWDDVVVERTTCIAQTATRNYPAYLDKCAYEGGNVLVDGDMEASGTEEWEARNGAIIAKVATFRPGSTGTQVMRITGNGVDTSPGIRQSSMDSGELYRLTGYARSVDGVNSPRITRSNTGGYDWVGTSSTSWQYFNVLLKDTKGTNTIDCNAVSNDSVVEFDDIRITKLPTRELYYVSKEALRVVYREDKNGRRIKGYLPEDDIIQRLQYTEDMSNGVWSKNAVTVSSNFGYAPNGEQITDKLVEVASSGMHYARQSYTVADSTRYTYSTWVRDAGRPALRLYVTLGATGNVEAYFDLSEGVTTNAANCTSKMEYWGNGLWRIEITFITAPSGDAGAVWFTTFLSSDDGTTISYQGDVTKGIEFWGWQLEEYDYATSYIYRESVAAWRLADSLKFKSDDGLIGKFGSNKRGAFAADILMNDHDTNVARRLFTLTDGGSAGDRITLYCGTADVYYNVVTEQSVPQVNSGGVTDISDGVIHRASSTWEDDDWNVFIDGMNEAQDTSCTMPDDLDEMEIGNYLAGAQFGGVIANLAIYDEPVKAA